MEENYRMEKTRDLFKKIGDIKGTFHARMGMIKNGKSKDLTEAGEIRGRDKNKQKSYARKFLMPLVTTSVFNHLEPDILAYEVSWALGSITTDKPGGGDGIPAELLKILEDSAVNVLCSIC